MVWLSGVVVIWLSLWFDIELSGVELFAVVVGFLVLELSDGLVF